MSAEQLAGDIVNIMLAKEESRKLIICKVTEPPPNLHLSFSEQTIFPKQIYVSNYLLPHYHRTYTIDGVIDSIDIQVSNYQYNNTTLTEATPTPHKHDIKSLQGTGEFQGNGVYKSHKDMWWEDTLKVGDEVLVAIVGVFYVVVSKITKMPSAAIEGV